MRKILEKINFLENNNFLIIIFLFFNFYLFTQIANAQKLCDASKCDQGNYSSEILVQYRGDDEIQKIQTKSALDFQEKILKAKNNPEVIRVEPNYYYQAAFIPNDPEIEKQWYLKKINAYQAWDRVDVRGDYVIAIIDSGVQIDHPDLASNIWYNSGEILDNGIDDDGNGFIDDIYGWDFVTDAADPNPHFTGEEDNEIGLIHGTFVAGVAAARANNKIGVSGVVPRARLMSLRALNNKGEGRVYDVVRAIDYAIKMQADIINLSFVGFGYSQSLANAIQRAYQAGIMIVAAAGNEEGEGGGYNLDETPLYPACHDGDENMVIGVGATDSMDQKTSFSSHGHCIDINAPGLRFFSTTIYAPNQEINNKYFTKYYDGYWSGTSMATPIISGALALIQEAHPNLTQGALKNILFDSAKNISSLNPNFIGKIGRGRVNLDRAIEVALWELAHQKKHIMLAHRSLPDLNSELIIEQATSTENFSHTPSSSLIEILDYNYKTQISFRPFPHFRGGVDIASGDVDGDGIDEIITAAGSGGGPHVRIFKNNGELLNQFFAYDKNFRGGVRVAVGNFDRGTRNYAREIITAAGPGGGPHVRVFSLDGNLKYEFFAYGDQMHKGVQISAGDLNSDGIDEIITGTGAGMISFVRVFEIDLEIHKPKIIRNLYPYNPNYSALFAPASTTPIFRGGVNVGVY